MGPPSATATTASVDNRDNKKYGDGVVYGFDRFASQNEEWIIRLQNLREEEEEAEILRRSIQDADGNDGFVSKVPPVTNGHFAAMRTILYTAKLANLQCASAAYREGEQERDVQTTTTTTNIGRLGLHVKHKIDTDGHHHRSMLENILGGGTATSQSLSRLTSQSRLRDDDSCTSIEVDAFFDDYPECGRLSLNEGVGHDSDSDSASDSDSSSNSYGEHEAASRHSKRRTLSSKNIASMTVDLVEAASEPLETQPEEQAQAQVQAPKGHYPEDQSGQQHQNRKTRPLSSNNNHANIVAASTSAAIKNPYSNRKPSINQSSSTIHRGQGNAAAIDLSGSATNTTTNNNNNNNDGQNGVDTDNNNNNNNSNAHRQIDPNPYRRSSSNSQNQPQTMNQSHHNFYEQDSNSNDAWMDHRNQTNPFQTARDVALAEQNHPHRDPFRNRGGDGPSRSQNQNPRQQQQQQQQQNSYNNPYGNDYQGSHGRSDPSDNYNDGNATAASNAGPFIPDSLKRKFQRPKRGLGSFSQGGTSNATNNRSHIRPSSSNPTNHNINHNNNTMNNNGSSHRPSGSNSSGQSQTDQRKSNETTKGGGEEDELPEELQHLDKELVKKIQNEIMESGDTVTFDDIAGLDDAKATVQEVVCWPMKRPDLFTGLRRAPNGLLLYGPPGTGKTLIGKAIAHESGATFFSISSSSLTSKWIGEGEKLVKTLFAVAAYNEPAVIFLDEIDSLLTQRKSSDNEASRRIKTEFLVQLDGTGTSGQGRVLIIGATNRPQELDEAARRRFTKRLYIPLPVEADRKVLLTVLLKTNNHVLTEADINVLAKDTKGFSGADLKSLCTDAAMGPIRQLGARAMDISVNDVPPISYKHFKKSLKGTRPSVAPGDLIQYIEWDKSYGTKRYDEDDDEDE